ncbi:hypothetical protein M427DRAFT_64752 [Gonapodya prolifera JEL478]|uniref:Uncharacterized protein n=1 Tax=Gonapodya prolifera (strain JEL478) TaxID=1344416 RepID=A0A138ZX87_GONPJ|nr:hypothetical protein M427DRAFT_64752 [Gonapodya prolifera JEL478]|eukprot:KXS09116.1 hypothetical protein M427DRAFT_64752 [Gonapodya prolifera JEL478]
MTIPEGWLDSWNGTWTSTKELEDSKVMDEILTIQGVSWMVRKAAAGVTPQDELKLYREGDVLVLEVKRKSMAGETLRKWHLDGREVELNEQPPTGHVCVSWNVTDQDGVLVQETKEVSGAWSSKAEWSVVVENGVPFHYRKINFQGKGKLLRLVQKFKKTA